MEIHVFHRYNRLVRRGLADPLTCKFCGTDVALRATEDGDPVLQCFMCETLTQPGLATYERIVAINKEFYV